MDVNEHERLSNTCRQIKVTEQHFRCSTFHNHKSVFNNENTSYPKLSVKQPL